MYQVVVGAAVLCAMGAMSPFLRHAFEVNGKARVKQDHGKLAQQLCKAQLHFTATQWRVVQLCGGCGIALLLASLTNSWIVAGSWALCAVRMITASVLSILSRRSERALDSATAPLARSLGTQLRHGKNGASAIVAAAHARTFSTNTVVTKIMSGAADRVDVGMASDVALRRSVEAVGASHHAPIGAVTSLFSLHSLRGSSTGTALVRYADVVDAQAETERAVRSAVTEPRMVAATVPVVCAFTGALLLATNENSRLVPLTSLGLIGLGCAVGAAVLGVVAVLRMTRVSPWME